MSDKTQTGKPTSDSDGQKESLDQPTKSSTSKKPIDPCLDITSEHFDPLKALYSKNVSLKKNIKVYDNLAIYEASLKKKSATMESKQAGKPAVSTSNKNKNLDNPFTSSSSRNTNDDKEFNPFQRKFLPHQMMVAGKGQKLRHTRNILGKLTDENKFGSYKGPISCLEKYHKDKIRVKILIRKDHCLLGHVTGFIEMFDKHWNIALSDCFEVWKRKKVNYCVTADMEEPTNQTTKECKNRLKKLKINLPVVTVKSLNRKYIECSRMIPQLLIRGEQIAVITTITETKMAVKL